jgi:proteasome beta subunit
MTERQLKTGTTTIGIVYKDGVLLAADKKTTLGGQIVASTKSNKVTIINDRIAVTTSGLVSDIQLLRKLISAQIRLEELRRGKKLNAKEASGGGIDIVRITKEGTEKVYTQLVETKL